MFLLTYPLDTCQSNFKTQTKVFFQTRLRMMFESKIYILRPYLCDINERLSNNVQDVAVLRSFDLVGSRKKRRMESKVQAQSYNWEILENGEQIPCPPIYMYQTYKESFQMNFPGRTVSHSPIDC